MQLLLVRHGQSQNNAVMESSDSEDGRVPDPALTELGDHQAAALAAWLQHSNLRPTRLCASLMRRTIQTALPTADAFGLPIEVRPDLFEAAGPYTGPYGDLTWHPGSTRRELAALGTSVTLPDDVTETGWWHGPVERTADVIARAQQVAAWLADQDDDLLLLVSHGAFTSILLSALLHPSALDAATTNRALGAHDLPVWFTLDNTSTSLVTLTPNGQTTVRWINRIDHLADLSHHQPSRVSFPFPPAVGPSHDDSGLA